MKNKFVDLTGQRFGRLVVIKRDLSRTGHTYWWCKCNCDTYISIDGRNLKAGITQSCGCLNIEISKRTNTKHGMSRTQEYKIWDGIHQRCYNPNNKDYYNYGGRGIKVCWRWHKDNPDGFKNFIEYMGRITDSNKNTIERFDNNGDYNDEGNVHKGWVDRVVQNRNHSNNKIQNIEEAEFIRDLYALGHSIKDIASGSGKKYMVIYRCVKRLTWR